MKTAKWLLAAGALALAFAGCTVTETEYVDRVVEKEVEKKLRRRSCISRG